ncbi:MAG: site-specific DNA-methyltransferase [Alphaproteobacteria bacterium]|nr:MAG: site-specific DNA-methyltransferase [Alphaproteobacteria bacterium]
MADRIEVWPVEKLIPYDRNPRTHSPEQVSQIAASIVEFGFLNPILVDTDAGIIAGHGRLQAAKQLGLAQVPVVVLDHLTETQKRAYVIADNKLALNAGWDEDLLRAELAALEKESFDLPVIGFSDEELADLLADPESGSGNMDEDAVPEAPENPVTKPGDVYVLGNHRLLCGDSTVLANVEKVLDGALADMVFTDPPYNVNYANTAKDKLRGNNRAILNDNLGEGFEAFLYDACVNMLTVCKGAVYVCMSSSELHTLQKAFVAAGGKWSTFVIWAKNTFTLGRADYQRQYEPILYGWKQGTDHFWCGARDQGDVWFMNKPRVNDLHPTMKPVELVERAIHNSSKSRDIVLDGFGGSGTTLIACEKAGRQARLIELDPKYCDVIVRRWEEFTGKKAELASASSRDERT